MYRKWYFCPALIELSTAQGAQLQYLFFSRRKAWRVNLFHISALSLSHTCFSAFSSCYRSADRASKPKFTRRHEPHTRKTTFTFYLGETMRERRACLLVVAGRPAQLTGHYSHLPMKREAEKESQLFRPPHHCLS